jgi:hypothetical protein
MRDALLSLQALDSAYLFDVAQNTRHAAQPTRILAEGRIMQQSILDLALFRQRFPE